MSHNLLPVKEHMNLKSKLFEPEITIWFNNRYFFE